MTHVDPLRLAVPFRRSLLVTRGVTGARVVSTRVRSGARGTAGNGRRELGTSSNSSISIRSLPPPRLPSTASSSATSASTRSSPYTSLHPRTYTSTPQPTSTIKTLMRSPLLFSSSPPSSTTSPSSTPPGFPPPKHTIVLCHGLYGYGVRRGKSKDGEEIHYWAHVHGVLEGCGAKVLVVEVPSKGSILERAQVLHSTLLSSLPPGTPINFLAHSMGGLDCRHLITHIKPDAEKEYVVKSLTCVATPHRGSPFMDWCKATIGLGTPLESLAQALSASSSPKLIPAWSLPVPLLSPMMPPAASSPSSPSSTSSPKAEAASVSSSSSSSQSSSSSLSSSSPSSPSQTPSPDSSSPSSSPQSQPSYFSFLSPLLPLLSSLSLLRDRLLSLCDSPAYYNLTTSYLNDIFNPSTPDSPSVRYFSIAARATSIPPIHPLFYTKMILDETARSGQAEREGWAGERYEGNDGMVSVSSAKWGEFLGIVDDCHHWDLRGKEGKLKAPILTSPSPSNPNPETNPDSAATTAPASSSSSSSTTTSSTSPSSPSSSSPPSPSSTSSSSAAEAWTLPDINASLTTYIDSTRELLPSFGSSSSSSSSSSTSSPATSSPAPSPSASSTPSSSSSSSHLSPSLFASSSTTNPLFSPISPSPSTASTEARKATQAAQAESESRFSSALSTVSSYLYLPGISWFGSSPSSSPTSRSSSSSSSSSSASSSSSSGKKESKGKEGAAAGGDGAGAEGEGGEGGGGVDQGLRERKEGKKEKFEIDRFYRAILLNLSNNGL